MRLLLIPVLALPTLAQAVVLSDGESTNGWRNVERVDGGPVGDHAVRYTLPPQGPAGAILNLPAGVELTGEQEIVFWYRFTGEGRSSLHLKVNAWPFADGWQATWQLESAAPADGIWRQAVVDLESSYLKWGGEPDTKTRMLTFRTEQKPGMSLALELDQVVLREKLFEQEVVRTRIVDGRAIAELRVRNTRAQPLRLEVRAGGEPMVVELAASAEQPVEVPVPLDAAWLADAPPLATHRTRLVLAAAGDQDSAKELAVTFAKPLELPPHPRLLITDAEVAPLRDKIATQAWAKKAWERELAYADKWLTKPVELPDRGGQWWHWYACKKDGASLKTLSPTEHQCPVCKTIYTGWPYDEVVLDRIHVDLARGLRSLGFVYRLTGDARYAAKAREILLAYAARYEQYPLQDIHGEPKIGGGRVGPQTLDESTWLIPMAQGADLIWDTLGDDDRQLAETGLFRPATEVIRQHKLAIHNIQCWKNSAVGLTGLLLGDETLIADAIQSPHGFKEQIARGITADGQWYEGAWGYHFYTMSAIQPLTEAAACCGLDLYGYEVDQRSYRSLFTAPLDLATPNLLLPAFNDSHQVNLKGQHRFYEAALRRYGEPRFAEVIRGADRNSLEALVGGLPELPEAEQAPGGSRNFLDAGYTVLQHSSDRDAAWACLKYGQHGGGHGPPDKLNLVLFRQGHCVGYDPGTVLYGVPLQKEWFRTTIAHNTLTVDETDQRPATGNYLASAFSDNLSAVLADAGAVYEGVGYRRAVALCGDNLVLVLDLVTADRPRTLDLAWHNVGAWSTPPAGAAAAVPAANGYLHLRDMVASAGPLPPVTVAENLSVGIAVAGDDGETWAGTGVGRNAEDRIPVVIRRVKADRAVVGWAISLDGRVPEVTVEGETVRATVGEDTASLTASPLTVEFNGQRLAASD